MATTSPSPFIKDGDTIDEGRQPTPPPLSLDDVGKVNRNGQFRGMLTGIAAGIGVAYFFSSFTNRPRKVIIMSSLLTSVAVSYVGGFAYVRDGMYKLEKRERIRANTDEMTKLDMQAGQHPTLEAGVAGMHDFQDRTHSTRGDH